VGEGQEAPGRSEAGQENDVGLGSSQDRGSTASAMGKSQVGEESGVNIARQIEQRSAKLAVRFAVR
jgi:hypothetical protein